MVEYSIESLSQMSDAVHHLVDNRDGTVSTVTINRVDSLQSCPEVLRLASMAEAAGAAVTHMDCVRLLARAESIFSDIRLYLVPGLRLNPPHEPEDERLKCLLSFCFAIVSLSTVLGFETEPFSDIAKHLSDNFDHAIQDFRKGVLTGPELVHELGEILVGVDTSVRMVPFPLSLE